MDSEVSLIIRFPNTFSKVFILPFTILQIICQNMATMSHNHPFKAYMNSLKY